MYTGMMRIAVVVLMSAGLFARSSSQNLYFPPLTGPAWDSIPAASLGWDTTRVDSLYRLLEDENTRAFLLLKDGRIVLEKYFGTFGADSAWYWASAGKTLTSMLVGIAQQEGYLSIADTTVRWLGNGWTSCPPAKEALITVRHQLTMTSGLDDGVADPYCTDPGCLQYLADAGNRWAYHNGPYTLLDTVVRIATGRTLNQYFQTRIASRTGMTGVFLKSGYNNVFFSTARSAARFGLLMLNRGRWDTTAVLSDTAYFHAMVNPSQTLNLSYGYLWWLNGQPTYMIPQTQVVFPGPLNPAAPPDMIAALGKNGQFINVVPGRGLVFIRMGDAPDGSPVPFLLNNRIWEKLNPILQPERRYPVSAGWNLVSVAQTVGDSSRQGLYPAAITDALGYDSGYVAAAALSNGRGYWLKFAGADTVTIRGSLRSRDTINLAAGWNLVGSISVPVPAESLFTLPAGILLSPLYGFGDGGYGIVSRLDPGKGYWLKARQAGKLVLMGGVGQAALPDQQQPLRFDEAARLKPAEIHPARDTRGIP